MSGYYLSVGGTPVAGFSDINAAMRKLKHFATSINVQIKKTPDNYIRRQSRGIYRRRLKPGDFTL